MEEPLEIPILNDITMVLGSISQVRKRINFTIVTKNMYLSSQSEYYCSWKQMQLWWILQMLQRFTTMWNRLVWLHMLPKWIKSFNKLLIWRKMYVLIMVCLAYIPYQTVHKCKQATAFGMKTVVYVPRINMETVSALSAFCEKATMVRFRFTHLNLFNFLHISQNCCITYRVA